MRADHAFFEFIRFIQENGVGGDLGAGAGRGGQADQREFARAQEVDAKYVFGFLPAADQRGDQLGHVNHAPAANAQDAGDAARPRRGEDLGEQLTRWLVVHGGRGHDLDAGGFQRVQHRAELRPHRGAGHQQHALDAALRQIFGALRRAAVAKGDARRLEQRDRGHGIRGIGKVRRFSSQPQRVHSLLTPASAGKNQLADQPTTSTMTCAMTPIITSGQPKFQAPKRMN